MAVVLVEDSVFVVFVSVERVIIVFVLEMMKRLLHDFKWDK
jgi:hypothetical protein